MTANTLRTFMLLAALSGLFITIGYLIGGSAGATLALIVAAVMNVFAYWNSDRIDCHEGGEAGSPPGQHGDSVTTPRDRKAVPTKAAKAAAATAKSAASVDIYSQLDSLEATVKTKADHGVSIEKVGDSYSVSDWAGSPTGKSPSHILHRGGERVGLAFVVGRNEQGKSRLFCGQMNDRTVVCQQGARMEEVKVTTAKHIDRLADAR